jgi:hypothetical protein
MRFIIAIAMRGKPEIRSKVDLDHTVSKHTNCWIIAKRSVIERTSFA